MIVIGADTHKASHALAAVDEGTGRVRGNRQIKADGPGHLAAVRWARELDERAGLGDRGLPRVFWALGAGAVSGGRTGRQGAAAPDGRVA